MRHPPHLAPTLRTIPLLAVALALALLAAPPAAAETLSWTSSTQLGLGSWQRPTGDLTAVVAGAVDYTAVTLFVDQPGVYSFVSDQGFDGFLVLYEGRFDPLQPLARALVADAGTFAGGNGATGFDLRLAAGVLYVLVLSGENPVETGVASNQVSGPGRPRFSSCFLGDEPFVLDANTEISLIDGRFCVAVSWSDFRGNDGIGTPVGYRADRSGLFWFFNPNNWELQLKVLNGCPVNGRWWVFFSATTTVEFEITVTDLAALEQKTYTNVLGNRADAITDTSAFDTCP